MPGLRDRQFNLIQFLYGFGAIVMLIAALSAVLEWEYARELFAGGIIVEIIVFIVSMIDIQPSEISVPQEIIFKPGMTKTTKESELQETGYREAPMDEVIDTLGDITRSIEHLRESTQGLAGNVRELQQNYKQVADSTRDYKKELDKLKARLESSDSKFSKTSLL